jgi:hypothetical protein
MRQEKEREEWGMRVQRYERDGVRDDIGKAFKVEKDKG